MTYEIWVDGGVSNLFESEAKLLDDVLNEFCVDAGYKSHSDYLLQAELSDSPFYIQSIK
jgi:hypothetical protein